MKFLLVIWYLATPSMGDPIQADPFEGTMPGLTSASVEELVYLKTIVILGFFDSQEKCLVIGAEVAAAHLRNLDPSRLTKDAVWYCIVDPKYDN